MNKACDTGSKYCTSDYVCREMLVVSNATCCDEKGKQEGSITAYGNYSFKLYRSELGQPELTTCKILLPHSQTRNSKPPFQEKWQQSHSTKGYACMTRWKGFAYIVLVLTWTVFICFVWNADVVKDWTKIAHVKFHSTRNKACDSNRCSIRTNCLVKFSLSYPETDESDGEQTCLEQILKIDTRRRETYNCSVKGSIMPNT